MARIYGSLDLILTAIVAQIIAQLPSTANEATCYVSIDPELQPQSNAGDYIYVVTPLGGAFDEAAWAGGGPLQMTMLSGFSVRIYGQAISLSDEFQRSATLLTQGSLGLIQSWIAVLVALANWDPLDVSANEMTRNPIRPTAMRFGPGGDRMGYIEQDFELDFDQYPGPPVDGAIPSPG